MKPITLPIAELKPALIGLGKIINTRATLAVLGTIKVERTADGWIALTSTDLDRWVTVRFEHPTEGPP
ncbi:MAG: DNA polymerase III subunit beta, partial [Verrucomicrobia bacterium]|nr:DNA polymerase III subunit beta [Verrucomicrobiota bacterium]